MFLINYKKKINLQAVDTETHTHTHARTHTHRVYLNNTACLHVASFV